MMRNVILALIMLASPVSAAKIVLVAGGGEGKDGSKATEAKLITPFGCDFDSKGRMYFVEFEKANRLRVLDDGKITTVAGTIEKGNVTQVGNLSDARFNGPHGIAIDNSDTIHVADTWNNCIQSFHLKNGFRYSKFESIWSVAGKITAFKSAFAVSLDPRAHTVIVTDLNSRQIFAKSDQEGVILAGNGKKGTPADGKKAVDEPLLDPRAAAMDSQGNLYILERGGHCLRVVNKDGIIKTVMGTGKAGTVVGKAHESQMNGPKHLCIDKDDSVIIADAENHRILRYIPKDEKVIVIAGTGKKGAAGLDGDPLKCELNRPHGVTIRPKTGELYICDSYNDRILKIVP